MTTQSVIKVWGGSADPTQPTDFTSGAIVRGASGEGAAIACVSGPANVSIVLLAWCELSLDGTEGVPSPYPPAPPLPPPSTYEGRGPTFQVIHYPVPPPNPGDAPAWYVYLAEFTLTPGGSATSFAIPANPGVVYPPDAILNAPSIGTFLYASASDASFEPGIRYQPGLYKSLPLGNAQSARVAAAGLLRRTPPTTPPLYEVQVAPLVYVALAATSATTGSVFDFAVTLS